MTKGGKEATALWTLCDLVINLAFTMWTQAEFGLLVFGGML